MNLLLQKINHKLKYILYQGFIKNKSLGDNLYLVNLTNKNDISLLLTFNPKINDVNGKYVYTTIQKFFMITNIDGERLIERRNHLTNFKVWLEVVFYFDNMNAGANIYVDKPYRIYNITTINKLYLSLSKLLEKIYYTEFHKNMDEYINFDDEFEDLVNICFINKLSEFFNI